MKTYVISVGGSAIVPDKIDVAFLKKLRSVVRRLSKHNKFVIVCGGGKTARDYISVLRADGVPEALACLAGIVSTKLNASLVSLFLRKGRFIPDSIQEIKQQLKRENVVVCGALGYQPNMTSDADAAQIAAALDADAFINVTDVAGLYTKNPKEFKDAKFISRISHADFWKMASRIKFKAGQHFVLDKEAGEIIKKHEIQTIIVKGLDNLEKVILGKPFKGTVIS
jgi:uridylate kinase